MLLYNNPLNYWMELLGAHFALGTRSFSKHSEMNLWKKTTSCVSELPVTGRVQAGPAWAASKGAGGRTWAQSERLGPPQGGPQLFLHSAWEVSFLLQSQLNSSGKPVK